MVAKDCCAGMGPGVEIGWGQVLECVSNVINRVSQTVVVTCETGCASAARAEKGIWAERWIGGEMEVVWSR